MQVNPLQQDTDCSTHGLPLLRHGGGGRQSVTHVAVVSPASHTPFPQGKRRRVTVAVPPRRSSWSREMDRPEGVSVQDDPIAVRFPRKATREGENVRFPRKATTEGENVRFSSKATREGENVRFPRKATREGEGMRYLSRMIRWQLVYRGRLQEKAKVGAASQDPLSQPKTPYVC